MNVNLVVLWWMAPLQQPSLGIKLYNLIYPTTTADQHAFQPFNIPRANPICLRFPPPIFDYICLLTYPIGLDSVTTVLAVSFSSDLICEEG